MRSDRFAPRSRKAKARLAVETLEQRLVPDASPQGPFFLATNGALYVSNDTLDGVVNTGGWGISLSVGKDQSGNPMAVIRDANNRVYVYDQGNWTDTGGYSRDLVAGVNGEVFSRDMNNRVYLYQLGVGWAPATTVGGNYNPIPHLGGNYDPEHAIQLSAGQLTVTDPFTLQPGISNVFYYRDPSNHIYVYRDAGAYAFTTHQFLPAYADTGGFGQDIAAGTHGEVFVRDMNNRLYVCNDGGETLSAYYGAGLADGSVWSATGAWALSLSVGEQADGSDFLAFKDANSQVYVYRTADGSFTNTGGFARQAVAGADEIYIRDFNDDVHDYNIVTGAWIDLGHKASLIRITSLSIPSSTPGHEDQGILLLGIDKDPGLVGHAFMFGAGSWEPAEVVVKDVEGYVGN